jgi:hypothetical protein
MKIDKVCLRNESISKINSYKAFGVFGALCPLIFSHVIEFQEFEHPFEDAL